MQQMDNIFGLGLDKGSIRSFNFSCNFSHKNNLRVCYLGGIPAGMQDNEMLAFTLCNIFVNIIYKTSCMEV